MNRTPQAFLLSLLAAFIAVSCLVSAQSRGGVADDAPIVVIAADSLALDSLPFEERLTLKLDALCAEEMFSETQLGLMVYDLDADKTLYALGERQLLHPASTMKLLTAITALDLLGKDYRYRTALYACGAPAATTFYGDLYITGTMDPTLEGSDLDRLVEGVCALHVDTISGRLVADRSFLDSPPLGKGWCWDDDNPTLTPLVYQQEDTLPAVLRCKLAALGISICGTDTVGTLPADAVLLAERYTRLETVLMRMLKQSDNLYAESVLYNIAGATQRPATAAVAQAHERALLTRIGLDGDDYGLADGSGLSLYNYLSAQSEVWLLRYAYHNITIFPTLIQSLPVAGVDGTLKWRLRGSAAAGNVRAKTGTLTGISTLAGYCTSPERHTLAFAILNQGITQRHHAHGFQDAVCRAMCEE